MFAMSLITKDKEAEQSWPTYFRFISTNRRDPPSEANKQENLKLLRLDSPDFLQPKAAFDRYQSQLNLQSLVQTKSSYFSFLVLVGCWGQKPSVS